MHKKECGKAGQKLGFPPQMVSDQKSKKKSPKEWGRTSRNKGTKTQPDVRGEFCREKRPGRATRGGMRTHDGGWPRRGQGPPDTGGNYITGTISEAFCAGGRRSSRPFVG